MFNRRQFIEAGIGSTLTAGCLPGIAAELLPPRPLPFRDVIIDSRYAVAADLGALLKAQGATLLAITGDITDLWSRHLRTDWQCQPQALAGMTAEDSLFTLQLVAQDAGLRLMHRTEHPVPAPDHRDPAMTLAAAHALLALDPRRWSPVPASLGPALTGGRPGATSLVVWVMAPRPA